MSKEVIIRKIRNRNRRIEFEIYWLMKYNPNTM